MKITVKDLAAKTGLSPVMANSVLRFLTARGKATATMQETPAPVEGVEVKARQGRRPTVFDLTDETAKFIGLEG